MFAEDHSVPNNPQYRKTGKTNEENYLVSVLTAGLFSQAYALSKEKHLFL